MKYVYEQLKLCIQFYLLNYYYLNWIIKHNFTGTSLEKCSDRVGIIILNYIIVFLPQYGFFNSVIMVCYEHKIKFVRTNSIA